MVRQVASLPAADPRTAGLLAAAHVTKAAPCCVVARAPTVTVQDSDLMLGTLPSTAYNSYQSNKVQARGYLLIY